MFAGARRMPESAVEQWHGNPDEVPPYLRGFQAAIAVRLTNKRASTLSYLLLGFAVGAALTLINPWVPLGIGVVSLIAVLRAWIAFLKAHGRSQEIQAELDQAQRIKIVQYEEPEKQPEEKSA